MAYSIDDTIKLIAKTPSSSLDAYGQEVFNETSRSVFCKVKSATRVEYFQARQTGLEPEYIFETQPVNYNGETIAEYKGTRFSIYRTYRATNDSIELYAQKEVGSL